MADKSSSIQPCPSCGHLPGQKVGPPALARCINPECEGSKLGAEKLADWNTRAFLQPATDSVDQPQGCCMGMAPASQCECEQKRLSATGCDAVAGDAKTLADALQAAAIIKSDDDKPIDLINHLLTPADRDLVVAALRPDVAGDVQAARTSEQIAWWEEQCRLQMVRIEELGDQIKARDAQLFEMERQARHAAQGKLGRQQLAKVIYATWFDADFITENHFAWFDAGKNNPDSCVHYSNVAKAFWTSALKTRAFNVASAASGSACMEL